MKHSPIARTEHDRELISTRENPGSDSSIIDQMLADLRHALRGLLSDLSGSGRTWFRGKSQQEMAKAQEILSNAIDRIGRLRLAEQQQTHQQKLDTQRQRITIVERNADIFLSVWERASDICKKLSATGVRIDARTMVEGALGANAGHFVSLVPADEDMQPAMHGGDW